MKKIFRKLKDKTPIILSCLAIVGVVGTVVTAVKATPKAIKRIEKLDNPTKKDIFKETWTEYIPTAALGVGTIICILGSNFLNKKSQATLTSAYAVMSNQFRRYSGEIKKRFGNETHEQIMHDIVADVHIMLPTVNWVVMRNNTTKRKENYIYEDFRCIRENFSKGWQSQSQDPGVKREFLR